MQETEINQILMEYGLNEKEAKIYLSNLKLGNAKVNEIAKEAKVLRETTYFILKSLIEKGLVSYVIKSGVKYFEAADPHKLIEILKEKETKISGILPDLLKLKKTIKEKPNVELYEGKSGLKTVIDDLIKTEEPIYTFSCTQSLIQKLQFYFPNYIKRRIKAKIPIKVLTEKTPETVRLKQTGRKELREVKFITKKYKFPNAIYIYGNKIALLDLEKNLTGIIIKDLDLNKTFKAIFNIIWDASENSV